MVTNNGRAETANLLGGVAAPVAFTYLANGAGSTAAAATQTTLVTENTTGSLGRAAAAMTRVTTTVASDTVQAVKTWTATGAGGTIREVGFFNLAAGGAMLCRSVLTADKVLAAGDSHTLTVKVAVA